MNETEHIVAAGRNLGVDAIAWGTTLAVTAFLFLAYLLDFRPGPWEPIVTLIVAVVATIGLFASLFAVWRRVRSTVTLCAMIAFSQVLLIYFIKFHPLLIKTLT